MLLTTRMKLVLEDAPETPVSGVKVALYDRDEGDPDDFLDSGVTDDGGEIPFRFDSSRYTDKEDSPSWRLESLPDLYIKIFNAQGEEVYSTRTNTMQDKLPKRFTVTIGREQAEGLIVGPTQHPEVALIEGEQVEDAVALRQDDVRGVGQPHAQVGVPPHHLRRSRHVLVVEGLQTVRTTGYVLEDLHR